MLRWFIGSFVPSKASICRILNFVGRGKCRTSAMNGDSVYCTRASIDTGARPFMTSFMWSSSCWMPLKRCSQDCASLSGWQGIGLSPSSFLPCASQWVCRGRAPWSVSNSALGLLYGHGILTIYECLLYIMSLNNIINYSKCP